MYVLKLPSFSMANQRASSTSHRQPRTGPLWSSSHLAVATCSYGQKPIRRADCEQYAQFIDLQAMSSQLEHLLAFKDWTFGTHQIIQPCRKPVCRLANLQLDNRDRAICVAIVAKILVTMETSVDIIARPLVALGSPGCRTLDSRRWIATCYPHVWSFVEAVFANSRR